MKRIIFLLSAVIFSTAIFAQAPQGINYQGVARDFTGAAISNTSINAVFTIRAGGPGGSPVFTESKSLSTDTFGLYTHVIGSVTSLSSVNWSGGNMWLQVDINGSTVATTQLQSVPYALYSGSSNGVVSVSSANSANITTAGTNTVTVDLSTLSPNPAGTYGSSTTIPQVTVDQYGRVTGISNQTFTTSNGTMTSLTVGPGLTSSPSGTITTAGGIDLPNVMGSAGSVGSATAIPVITYDQYGRITGVTTAAVPSSTVSLSPSTGINISPGGGNTYTISAQNGSNIWNANALQNFAVNPGAPSNGQVLQYNSASSEWVPSTLPSGTVNVAAPIIGNGTAGNPISLSILPGAGMSSTSVGTGTVTLNADLNSPLWNANSLQNVNISSAGPVNGQVLQYNGTTTNWEPANVPSGTVTTSGFVQGDGSVANPVTLIPLPDAHIIIGDASNAPTATVVTGDMSLSNTGSTRVEKLHGDSLVITSPAVNDVLHYNGTKWVNAPNTSSSLPIGAAGSMLYDSAGVKWVASNPTGLYTDGTNIGIGTNTPAAKIDIQTSSTALEINGTATSGGNPVAHITSNDGTGYGLRVDANNGAAILGISSGPYAIGGYISSGSGNAIEADLTNGSNGTAIGGILDATSQGIAGYFDNQNSSNPSPTVKVISTSTVSSAYSATFNGGMGVQMDKLQIPTGAGVNKVLTSDASGNATWQNAAGGLSPTLASGNIFVGNASNVATGVAMSGDASISNTGALTLASIMTAGSYPKVTVDAKGRVTAGFNTIASSDIAAGAVNLATQVSGILPTANGGMGASMNAGAIGAIPYANSTTTYTTLASGAAGLVLKSNGAGTAPSWQADNAGAGTVTTVTVASGVPISVTSPNTTPTLSMTPASSTVNGYLTSADWNTFNGKLGTALPSANIFVGNAGGVATATTVSGDATMANTGALTLAATGVTPGAYGNASSVPTITVDAKGRITNISTTAITVSGTLSGGTANYVPKWLTATSLSSTSLLFDNGTAVGVNNTSPAALLDVVSTATATTAAVKAAQAGATAPAGTFTITNAVNGAAALNVGTSGTGFSGLFNGGQGVKTDKITIATGAAAGAILTSNTASGDAIWSTPASVVSSGGGWTTTGNTGTTASSSSIGTAVNNNFIGTTDAKDFVMASNNLERVRITSAGNVGVGIVAPLTNIHVYHSNPEIRVESSGGAFTAGYSIKTATQQWFMGQETGAAGLFRLKDVTSGVVRMQVAGSTGYVGINTTSAANMLDVASTTSVSAINGVNSNGATGGNAGNFLINNASNNSAALNVTTTGGGNAGYFSIGNTGSTNPVLYATTNGKGGAAVFSVTNSAATGVVVDVSNAGLSQTGSFITNNSGNSNNVLSASGNGSGSTIIGTSTGTGRAAFFEINTNTNNNSDVLYATTFGKGKAGYFEINNSANTQSAVYATTNGSGLGGDFNITNASNPNPAVQGVTNGSGSAVRGSNTGSGAAIYGTVTGTGNSGYFNISNNTSSTDVVFATTNGSGHGFNAAVLGGAAVYGRNSSATVATIDAMNGGGAPAGLFAAGAGNNADVVKATTPAGGTALVGINSGTGGAGFFNITAGTNTVTALVANTGGTGYSASFGGGNGMRTDAFSANIRTINSSTTITPNDHFIVVTGAGGTITLPPAASNTGKIYIIKNTTAAGWSFAAGSTYVNNTGAGGQTSLPGTSTFRLISDGANWQAW